MRNRRRKKLVGLIIYHILLISMFAMFVAPFVWMVSASIKPHHEIFSYPPTLVPREFILSNFSKLFNLIPFFRQFLNSVIVSVSYTLLTLFLCSLAGFAFAKYTFPFKSVLFVIILASMMIPIHVTLIPLFVFMARMGWVDTYRAVIIPFSASALGVFLFRQYMITIPSELLDIARIDGCPELGIYFQIMLPLARPVIGVLTIFFFMTSWNNLLWPLIILNSEEMYTLPLGLAGLLGSYEVLDYGPLIAGAFLAVLPIIIIFLAMQKQFISGLTLGAVKG